MQSVRAILVTRFSQGWCESWLGARELENDCGLKGEMNRSHLPATKRDNCEPSLSGKK